MRRYRGRPHLHQDQYGGGGVVHLLNVEKIKEKVKENIVVEKFILHLEHVHLPNLNLIKMQKVHLLKDR